MVRGLCKLGLKFLWTKYIQKLWAQLRVLRLTEHKRIKLETLFCALSFQYLLYKTHVLWRKSLATLFCGARGQCLFGLPAWSRPASMRLSSVQASSGQLRVHSPPYKYTQFTVSNLILCNIHSWNSAAKIEKLITRSRVLEKLTVVQLGEEFFAFYRVSLWRS
jgi:hypothetical protein